jgi:hypothetical protein
MPALWLFELAALALSSATNVIWLHSCCSSPAESSVTIPHVKHVIDACTANQVR